MNKNTIPITVFALLLASGVLAQSSLNSSGGNATGAGGAASYSLGQLAYTASSGTGGSASAGVQQPIEIFTSDREEMEGILLSASAFPNPVESDLTLQLGDSKWQDLAYQLSDLNGKILFTSPVRAKNTRIPFAGQPVGTYTLRVVQGQIEIKSFRILKNK